MSNMELVKVRPRLLDDITHIMRVDAYFGRPDDEVQVKITDITDYYLESHYVE